jgi:hypothetical protein
VQVQVQDIDSEVARTRDAGEGVHVGAVHIEQGPAFMKDRGDFSDALFEGAERAGICHHQGSDVLRGGFA